MARPQLPREEAREQRRADVRRRILEALAAPPPEGILLFAVSGGMYALNFEIATAEVVGPARSGFLLLFTFLGGATFDQLAVFT